VNVLDLDLDFFLKELPLPKKTGRLNSSEYHPWSASKVEEYLETRWA